MGIALPGRHPLDREIAVLAIPALGALVAEPLYILADTAVVGRISTSALAGLAIASSGLLIGFSAFIFLAYGTTAAVSRLLGAGMDREAAHEGMQSVWLAVVLGVGTAVASWVFADPIIGVLGGASDPEVREHAMTYFTVSLWGVPFQLIVLAGTGYLRGLLDTRTPLIVAVVAAVVNLVLELWWIIGLGYGIEASAMATVTAQVLSAAVYLWVIVRAVIARGAVITPDLGAIWRLLRVGWDLMIRTLALRGSLTVATAIAARIGAVEVAAHEVAFAIWNLLALTLDALAISGQALVGRFLGASDERRAWNAGHRMIELGLLLGVLLGLLAVVTKPWLPGLFSNDAAVLGTTATLLWWVAVMQPLNGLAFVLDGLLIGASDMEFLAVAMVFAAAAFAVAAGLVVFFGGGIIWVWASIGVLMLSRVVVLGWRWRSGRWAVLGT